MAASKAIDWDRKEIFEAIDLALKEVEFDVEFDGKTTDTRK